MEERIDAEVEELLQHLYALKAEGGVGDAASFEPRVVDAALAGGYVTRDAPGGCTPTETGMRLGQDVIRRHRLAECLLHDVIESGDGSLDEDACHFEHILRAGLDERVCRLLGHPDRCPHGKPIPEGECCRRARADTIREVAPLCDGRPGDRGTVAYLATRDSRDVQKMMAMGILPGAGITLIQRFPSYVFRVGYSQFAVDRPLAEIIHVHWTPRAAEAPSSRPPR